MYNEDFREIPDHTEILRGFD
jgi:hypothetical protein